MKETQGGRKEGREKEDKHIDHIKLSVKSD
jgi:hypothetical protein